MSRPRKPISPFRYFNSSPEIIRLVVIMYVRYPLSLRHVDQVFVKINRETHYLWRAVDHEGDPLENLARN